MGQEALCKAASWLWEPGEEQGAGLGAPGLGLEMQRGQECDNHSGSHGQI